MNTKQFLTVLLLLFMAFNVHAQNELVLRNKMVDDFNKKMAPTLQLYVAKDIGKVNIL